MLFTGTDPVWTALTPIVGGLSNSRKLNKRVGGTGTVNGLDDHEQNGGQTVQDTRWFRYFLNAARLLPKVAISRFLPMKTISQS